MVARVNTGRRLGLPNVNRATFRRKRLLGFFQSNVNQLIRSGTRTDGAITRHHGVTTPTSRFGRPVSVHLICFTRRGTP